MQTSQRHVHGVGRPSHHENLAYGGGARMDEGLYARNAGRIMSAERFPIIAIIVPMYHAEKFAQRCLDSINSQYYPHYNVYAMIDGANDDRTVDICREHPLYRDGKLKLIISSGKSSPAKARNRALNEIGNEQYVAFLDVDDTWERDKLGNQLRYMIKKQLSVCFTSGWWHRDFGTFKMIMDDYDVDRAFKSCMFLWSSVMFHRQALNYVKSCRGYVFDESFPQCDDGELLAYMYRNYKFGSVNIPLVHLYEHGGNLTQGNIWKPNYWAYRAWAKNGYYITGIKHIIFGIVAVVSDMLGIRGWIRKKRMVMHMRFGIDNRRK